MGFEDLPDVHARRHAERVEHDIDRRTVLQIRHVLFREDAGQDALVAVPAGHLVADLQAALDGHEHLDHLDDAGRQLVAALEPLDLAVAFLADGPHTVGQRRGRLVDPVFDRVVADPLDPIPQARREFVQHRFRDLLPLGEHDLLRLVVGYAHGRLPTGQYLRDLAARAVLNDADFFVPILLQALNLRLFDGLAALVGLLALAREDPHVDDRAFDTRRHLERGVAHFAGLFAEDGPQQFFFGRQLGFALGRDLADENVQRPDLGADAHDAALIEIGQRLFADVGNVPG